MELTSKPIGETPYADILGRFHDGQAGRTISTQIITEADPLSSDSCFYAAAAVPTGSWTVVMELPRQDVLAKIRGPLLFTLLVASIGFTTVLGLIYWLTLRLTQPLELTTCPEFRLISRLTG